MKPNSVFILATELHRFGSKSKGKSVLIRAICGKDSQVEPKASFSPDSRNPYSQTEEVCFVYKRLTGMQDILPEDQPYWRFVRKKIDQITALYGFERLDVPIIEETGLYVRGVGQGTDIVDKEMYSFQDKGKDNVTLRPEFTAGFMRSYVENHLYKRPQPVKLFTIGPIFRYERPQAGRFRQHTQFNVEALGVEDPAIDFEVMSLAHQFFSELGFQGVHFQLNSTGCPQCRPQYIERLQAHYRLHYDEICDDCKRRLDRSPLRVLDCKASQCQPVIASAPKIADYLCDDCRLHFQSLLRYLDNAGLAYIVNHRLVRGLDYYRKTVFEVWVEGIGAQAAVCGGGRYDGLGQEIGGPPTPGIGFGSGIERIVMAMKAQGLTVPGLPKPQVLVAYLGKEAKERAVPLVQELRWYNIGVILPFGDRSLKSQLRQANRERVRYVVIIGEDELARGRAQLRDLQEHQQQDVPLDTLRQWLSERLPIKAEK